MSITTEMNKNQINFDPILHRPPKYDIFGRLVNNKLTIEKK